MLDVADILSKLKEKDIEVELFETINSTYLYLQEQNPKSHLRVVLAEEQTAGIGRQGRSWCSPKYENIYLSLSAPIMFKDIDNANITQSIAKLVIQAIEELYNIDELSIKYPNDVFYRGKKLSGSMADIRDTPGRKELIIGIGVNVNMRGEKNIDQPWTSLSQITGRLYDRNDLIAKIVELIISWIREKERGY